MMAKKKIIMELQTGITILIGVVILGGIGWLAIEVNGLGKDVTEFKTISIENKERMNRIGENIPQIKSVLATIEIEKLLNNALIAFEPQRDSNEVWNMKFALADVSNSELTSYTIELDSQQDNYVMMASSGTILNSENGNVLSFYDFQKFSNTYVEIPNHIDSKNSWMISGSTDHIMKLLKSKAKSINTSEIKITNRNLQSLIDSLKVQ